MSEITTSLPSEIPLSPLYFLERSAAVFPEKLAIIYGERRYSYQDFADQAKRLAVVIRSRIAQGDRVAYLAPNIPELLIAHFAVPLAGGVLVTLNTRLAGPEIEYILNHCGATLLFVDLEYLKTVKDVLARVPSIIEVIEIVDNSIELGDVAATIPTTSYPDFLAESKEIAGLALEWGVRDENEFISINYTSGTTGNPKGVIYTHRGAYLNSLGFVYHNGYTGDTRYLWTLPMFHCNGWCTTWAVTAAAGLHVCLRAVRPDAVWAAIDEFQISHLCGAPTVCSFIAEAPQAHALERPIRITTGGAPPSPTIIRKLEAIGATLIHAYGLTEVYGPYTICEYQDSWNELSADDRAARMARQGVGMLQAGIPRIVDPEMNDVPADGATIGEIVMRGNNVTVGYYRDEDATREAFRGGLFHTGDLGVMHPDGYIEVRDRAKDLIISGGENISSIEVENAILTHPAVLDAAVVGMPDAKWGERPLAYIVPKQGQEVSAADIITHLRSLVAPFKVPDRIIFLSHLPRTSTGKVLKRELREDAAP